MLTYDAFSFIQVTFLLFIFVGLGCALLAERPTPSWCAHGAQRRPALHRRPAAPRRPERSFLVKGGAPAREPISRRRARGRIRDWRRSTSSPSRTGARRPFAGLWSRSSRAALGSSDRRRQRLDDSTRGLLATLPVETIALSENGGFAHGCNVGAAAGNAPYVLFLNPDARLEPGSVESLVAVLDRGREAWRRRAAHRRAGRLARLLAAPLPARALGLCPGVVPASSLPCAEWVDEVIRDPRVYERPHAVEWVSGAVLLVRRSVLEQIGGLDESFFHYSEDVDLCTRIWDAGLRGALTCQAPSPCTRAVRRRRAPARFRSSRQAASVTRTKHDRPASRYWCAPALRSARRRTRSLHEAGWSAAVTSVPSLVALKPLPAEPSHLVRGVSRL